MKLISRVWLRSVAPALFHVTQVILWLTIRRITVIVCGGVWTTSEFLIPTPDLGPPSLKSFHSWKTTSSILKGSTPWSDMLTQKCCFWISTRSTHVLFHTTLELTVLTQLWSNSSVKGHRFIIIPATTCTSIDLESVTSVSIRSHWQGLFTPSRSLVISSAPTSFMLSRWMGSQLLFLTRETLYISRLLINHNL